MKEYIGQRVTVITESGTFDGVLQSYSERFATLTEVNLLTEHGTLKVDGVALVPTHKIDWVQVA